MSPSSLRHISIVFTGKVLAQSSQPVANFFLGKKCISWRLRAENSAYCFTCRCDFSSQEQNCVSISIAKPGRQIFIEEKHTSSPTQTPHTSHHTYTFSFFQRHTSLLHDWVISCSTTNGLLTFPLGESQKPCPEVTLCPLSIDFLRDVHSSFPFTVILPPCSATQFVVGKSKRNEGTIFVSFLFKMEKWGWVCKRIFIRQYQQARKQRQQTASLVQWECSLHSFHGSLWLQLATQLVGVMCPTGNLKGPGPSGPDFIQLLQLTTVLTSQHGS